MSDPLPSPAAVKPARSFNRWGLGTIRAVQTGLLIVIVIAANYLSFHHYRRLDLSRTADYTLSSATRRYLTSQALTGRKQPVKWIMAYRRTSPFYERVRALAEEYERHSRGKVNLIVVDPLRNPDRMQEITAAYGLTLLRDMILIDARNDESAVTHEDADQRRSLNSHIKIVVAEDMATFTTVQGVRKANGFQGEDHLTARLVEAIEGQPRKMILLADKSRLEAEDQVTAQKVLSDTLRFQNITLEKVQIAGMAEIAADVSGVVLAAPRYDLTVDELAVLERYWRRPKAAILVMADGELPPRLRAFLRNHGITAQKDRVIAREGAKLVTAARGVFTQGISFTRDLAGQSTEFGGDSCSLDVREGADDLLARQIFAMGVVQASPGFWGESKFGQGAEVFDERDDHAAPMFLVACATRGRETDDPKAQPPSRLVVFSNTDFLQPRYQRAENLDLLASSANWLVGRGELAGIGPRSLGTYKLPLLDAQVSLINRVNLFFLPAFLLVIGAFVWSSRRV